MPGKFHEGISERVKKKKVLKEPSRFSRFKRRFKVKERYKYSCSEYIVLTNRTGSTTQPKIPRPANAFMLYANENRKKVAKQFPEESNKEISCRLGNQWKSLNADQKNKYFSLAKQVDADHKKKYPDYVYNPKEARIRKALRERERSMGNGQVGLQRARRSPHWATQKPSPMHMQHSDNLMATPVKEVRDILRTEFANQGFLNGPHSYLFPGQQYSFPAQSDYATYIHVGPNSWMPNGYVQGNHPIVQQQFWSQYQADRMRAHHSQAPPPPPPTYMVHQQPEPHYQPHVTQPEPNMPSSSLLHNHMETAAKEMITNIENSSANVSSYLNMSSNMSCTSNSSSAEVKTPTNVIDVAAACEEGPANLKDNNQASVDSAAVNDNSDLVPGTSEASSMPVISTDDEHTELPTNPENSDTSFDIQLFEENNIPIINQHDLHKTLKSSNSEVTILKSPIKEETIPEAHLHQPETLADTLSSTFFGLENLTSVKQYVPVPFENYYMEILAPEFSVPNPEDVVKKEDFPIDFSAQKYYESVNTGAFEASYLPGETFENFICDDGFSFVTFANSPDTNFTFQPIFEGNQYFPGSVNVNQEETKSINKSEHNFILDLSKNENESSGIEVFSPTKFVEVSNRICEELCQIIK